MVRHNGLFLTQYCRMAVMVVVEVVMVVKVRASPQQIHGKYDQRQKDADTRYRNGNVYRIDDFSLLGL